MAAFAQACACEARASTPTPSPPPLSGNSSPTIPCPSLTTPSKTTPIPSTPLPQPTELPIISSEPQPPIPPYSSPTPDPQSSDPLPNPSPVPSIYLPFNQFSTIQSLSLGASLKTIISSGLLTSILPSSTVPFPVTFTDLFPLSTPLPDPSDPDPYDKREDESGPEPDLNPKTDSKPDRKSSRSTSLTVARRRGPTNFMQQRYGLYLEIQSFFEMHDYTAAGVEFSVGIGQVIKAGLGKKLRIWDPGLILECKECKSVDSEVRAMPLCRVYLLAAVGVVKDNKFFNILIRDDIDPTPSMYNTLLWNFSLSMKMQGLEKDIVISKELLSNRVRRSDHASKLVVYVQRNNIHSNHWVETALTAYVTSGKLTAINWDAQGRKKLYGFHRIGDAERVLDEKPHKSNVLFSSMKSVKFLGEASYKFQGVVGTVKKLMKNPTDDSQYLPPLIIGVESRLPAGSNFGGDTFVTLDDRIDHSLMFIKALEYGDFAKFDRVCTPRSHYVRLHQNAGELKFPSIYFVFPAGTDRTSGEYLVHNWNSTVAGSEPVELGHISLVLDDNWSNYFDAYMAGYVEFPIDFGMTFKVQTQRRAVEKVFDEIPHRSIVSFSTMNYGFASIGFGIGSLQLFLDMLKAGIHLNCGNLVMTMNLSNLEVHLNLGNIESRMCFFSEMDVKRFISWTLMTMFFLERGGSAEILEVFTEGRANGVEHDIVTMANFSNACAIAGALRKGRRVHNKTLRRTSRIMESIPSDPKRPKEDHNKAEYLHLVVMLMGVGHNIGAEILSLSVASDTRSVLQQFKHVCLYNADQGVLEFLANTEIGTGIGVLNIQLLRSGSSQAEETIWLDINIAVLFPETKFIYNAVGNKALTANPNSASDLKQGVDPWVYKIYEFMDALESYTTISQWEDCPSENGTWEDIKAHCRLYLVSHLEDKVVLKSGGIDTILESQTQAQFLGLMQPHSIVTEPCSSYR